MIFCTAGRTADRINLKMNAVKLKSVDYGACKADKLCIGNRVLCTVLLNTELVELTKSACLRLFITIARNKVACLNRKSFVFKSVFKNGSCRTGCTLGAKRYAFAALCVECVHFFLNNIGCLTNATGKKLCVLKHGSSDFSETVGASLLTHNLFNKLPFVAFLRKNIFRTLDFLGYKCHFSLRKLQSFIEKGNEKISLKNTTIGQYYTTRYVKRK